MAVETSEAPVPATTLPEGVKSAAAVVPASEVKGTPASTTPAPTTGTQPAAGKPEIQPKPAETAPAAPAAPKSLLATDETKSAPTEKKSEPKADAPKPESTTEPKADEAKPEGWKLEAPKDSGLSADDLKGVEAWAKESKLTPAQAQAVLNREALTRATVAKTLEAKSQEAYTGMYKTFEDQIKADAEFGGEKLKSTIDAATRALRTYADPELRQLLNTTPFGSHPLFIRFAARIGALLKEDTAIAGPAPAPEKSVLDRWYPNTKA